MTHDTFVETVTKSFEPVTSNLLLVAYHFLYTGWFLLQHQTSKDRQIRQHRLLMVVR
jgi:hypothetical protein